MSLDYVIKDILRDIEKLKEISTGSEILDEIMVFTIPATVTISGAVRSVSGTEFAINPTISPEISTDKNQFAAAPSIAPVMTSTAQDTGTFLVGTARVGFSDAS